MRRPASNVDSGWSCLGKTGATGASDRRRGVTDWCASASDHSPASKTPFCTTSNNKHVPASFKVPFFLRPERTANLIPSPHHRTVGVRKEGTAKERPHPLTDPSRAPICSTRQIPVERRGGASTQTSPPATSERVWRAGAKFGRPSQTKAFLWYSTA